MKNSLLKKPLLIVMLLIGSLTFGQSIKGVVTDADGSLPGVSITIKGTTTGVQTDFDGNYAINASQGDVLVFSYLGYTTEERSVGSQNVINVTMIQDRSELDEIVIIGYGSTTIKDATGAVASVKAGDFNQGVISSPEQLIQGKTAGVQIASASGEPGAGIAIRIRGSNSIRSNNNPLFVVDGIPLSDESTVPSSGGVVDGGDSARNPLSFINSSDIESISVLKDASATAIYGSRGSNGVIIITTKSGKNSRGGVFEFSSNLSFSDPANRYDLFNADQYRSNFTTVTGNQVPTFDDAGGNTDWQNVIMRSTVSSNTNFTYSNSYDKGNLRASFSYADQNGILEKSGQERISGRINATQFFLEDKLKLNVQSSFARVNDEVPLVSGGAGASGNIIGAAYAALPTWPNDSNFFLEGNRLNPANMLANYDATTETDRLLLNASLEYSITDNLTAKVNLGYDTSDSNASSLVTGEYNNSGRITGNGQASYNTLEVTSNLVEFTMNYNKDFENSNLDATLGSSFQDFRRQGFSSQGWGIGGASSLASITSELQSGVSGSYQQFGYDSNSSFVNRLSPFNNSDVLSAGSSFSSLWLDAFDNTDELQSFFGRVNYSLNEKYLFTATVRADGSSRFGTNSKYGFFPSAAFAWKLSEEDFVGENISTLKLRTSAGITGNQGGLGYANYLKRQRFSSPGISDDGTINRPGLTTVAVQNPDLKWESTLDLNVGLDWPPANFVAFTGPLKPAIC